MILNSLFKNFYRLINQGKLLKNATKKTALIAKHHNSLFQYGCALFCNLKYLHLLYNQLQLVFWWGRESNPQLMTPIFLQSFQLVLVVPGFEPSIVEID